MEGGGRRGVFWRVAWRKREGGEGLEASGVVVAVAGRGMLDSELLRLAGRKTPRRGGLGQACWAAGRQVGPVGQGAPLFFSFFYFLFHLFCIEFNS